METQELVKREAWPGLGLMSAPHCGNPCCLLAVAHREPEEMGPVGGSPWTAERERAARALKIRMARPTGRPAACEARGR